MKLPNKPIKFKFYNGPLDGQKNDPQYYFWLLSNGGEIGCSFAGMSPYVLENFGNSKQPPIAHKYTVIKKVESDDEIVVECDYDKN